MSEVKDPKIKLFGKTIELPETFTRDPCSASEDSNLNVDEEEQESNKSLSVPKETDSKVENQCKPSTSEDLKDSSGGVTVKASKNKEDQNESSNSQDQKALLKPDKIIPCPRCNSMETKFCYFNNYNVNQPRHFCKNCQRYWTAGGTMRNVPVGAGRRKSKHLASQYRHITGPESLSGGRVDLPNGLHNPPVNQNGAVLTFGSNTPLCESMASGLSIGDKTTRCNRFQELEVSRSNKENVESGSSLDARPDMMPNCHSFPLTMPCFPRAPWGYPFYPTIGPSTFPVPIYPTAPPYWNFAVPGTWNVPLNFPPMPTAPGSGPISPTLGKHSREESTLKLDIGKEEVEKESDSEKCLWVPKTLRIDDPGEAAKSSIWATLGIKKDTDESIGVVSGSLCKAFESKSKGDEKTRLNETSTVLQANPAALSRSLSFHESS